MSKVVFNNPFFFNNTRKNINKVLTQKIKETTGGKVFFKKSCNFLEKKLKAKKIIVTNSCTAALEVAALLIDVKSDGSFRMNMNYFDYCGGLTMTNQKFHQHSLILV